MEAVPFLAVVYFAKFVVFPGLLVLWANLSPPEN